MQVNMPVSQFVCQLLGLPVYYTIAVHQSVSQVVAVPIYTPQSLQIFYFRLLMH